MNKLVIIDGNSLLFRAHFAMRPMVTSGGVHTQGIYAFVNMLNKIIRENEPDYLAVCFDMKAKTLRTVAKAIVFRHRRTSLRYLYLRVSLFSLR